MVSPTTSPAALPLALRNLIHTLRQHPPGSSTRLLLDTCLPHGQDADCLDWLIRQARQEQAAIVFRFESYGYVLLGLTGQERTYPDPQLSGLYLAHEIFTHGTTSASTYRVTSPNAARNALERAATWAERHCYQLAGAIREISIGSDGAPIFSPNYPLRLSVF